MNEKYVKNILEKVLEKPYKNENIEIIINWLKSEDLLIGNEMYRDGKSEYLELALKEIIQDKTENFAHIEKQIKQDEQALSEMDDENFIQNKYGYCYYQICKQPLIYNLYVQSQYRQHGHARRLLSIAIDEIRRTGYCGEIEIVANPRENSVDCETLISFYRSMGLKTKNKINKNKSGESK